VQAQGMQDRPTDQCPTCRGHGWLNVRSRPVYRSVVLNITRAALSRETCWDCGGTGRLG
jgi:DnaJ-class molecular chaperone